MIDNKKTELGYKTISKIGIKSIFIRKETYIVIAVRLYLHKKTF